MDLKDFSERFILLKSGACCAIIKQQSWESNLLVVLSPSGSFTNIYYEGNHHKHMTRFTPTRFQKAVMRIVAFRNTFTAQPFHCKRFESQTQNLTVDTKNWNLCPSLPSSNNNTHVYMCPLQRRVQTVTEQYVAEDDNCIEYPIRGADVARAYVARVANVYPLHRLPRAVELLLYQSASESATSDPSNNVISLSPSAGRTSVSSDSASETRELLTALMSHMSLMALDRDVYPVSVTSVAHTATAYSGASSSGILSDAGLVAMVEQLDGDIYLVSNAPQDTIHASMLSRRAQLLKSVQTIQEKLAVNSNTSGVSADHGGESNDQTYNGELEVEVWIDSACDTTSTDSPVKAQEVILQLKGDYFTFCVHPSSAAAGTADANDVSPPATTSSIIHKSCHNSFLQFELQRRARILDVETECDNMYSIDHTSTTATAALGTEEVDPAHLPDFSIGTLMSAYYKQALKLLRYRDYLLEQVHRCSRTSKSIGIGAVLSVDEDTSRSANTHSSHAAPSYDSVTSSCSTVSLNTLDGTSFSAVLKQCGTPEEVAHYAFNMLHVPSHALGEYPHSKVVQSIVAENRVYPCDCVTQLTGIFADRTMIKFDPSTQIFSMLFGSGRECSFSLGSYKREDGIFASAAYIPVTDDSFHNTNSGRALPMHGINIRRPSQDELNIPQITHYVRRLLAFHRYAATPVEHRQALLEHEEHTRQVARSGALQNFRHTMVHSVAKGLLSPLQASQRTREFEHKLNLSRASPMAQPPIMVSPDRRTPPSGSANVSASSHSPFGYMTPSPAPRRVALVSGGSTIGSSDRSSSLTYSQLSAASSLNNSSSSSYPQHRGPNIVTPESVRDYMQTQDSVTHVADALAGKYLHANVSIHPKHEHFGTPPPARAVVIVSPEAKSYEDIMSRSRELCSERRNIHIPNSHKNLPNYSPTLHAGTASYLSDTYIQDALEAGARIMTKNAEYLKKFHVPA